MRGLRHAGCASQNRSGVPVAVVAGRLAVRYLRNGPTSARSTSVRCMTSVCRVAGRTASRQSGKRSSISAAWSRRTKSRSPIDQERRRGDAADLVGGPAREVVHHRLQPLEEREEVVGVRRHRVVVGLPLRELFLGRQPRVVLLGRGDLGVVAVGPDVRSGQHQTPNLRRMTEGQARRGERAEAVAPHVDGPAAREAIDQLGDVVGETLDRYRAAGIGRVTVALELDPDDPAAGRQPREDVDEAALEREDAAVQRNERRAAGVAVLLVPDRDAVDVLVGHASTTSVTRPAHR